METVKPEVIQLLPKVDLNIDLVEPAIPVEGRPIHIHFTVTNTPYNSQVVEGWIGASITPAAGGAYDSSTFWRIEQVSPGTSSSGVVTVAAPPAAAGNAGLIYLFNDFMPIDEFQRPGPHLAEDSFTFHCAARFRIGLTELVAHDTRGPDIVGPLGGDDLAVAIGGSVGGQMFDSRDSYLGHPRSGTTFTPDLVLSPIDLIPGVSPNLEFAFLATALPNSSLATLREVLDGISHVGALIASAALPAYSAGFALGDELQQYMDKFGTEDCDGPVAGPRYSLSPAYLVEATSVTNSFEQSGSQEGTPSGVRCGGLSHYSWTITVRRMQRDEDTLTVTPTETRARNGQPIAFNVDIPIENVYWRVQEGALKGTITNPGGVYTPSGLTNDSYVTIQADELRTDGAPPRVATAFVSLAYVETLKYSAGGNAMASRLDTGWWLNRQNG